MTLLLTIVFFGMAMAAMGVGVIVSDRSLRGSCGGPEVHDEHGDALSCGACPSKSAAVCPDDDELVRIARVAYPRGHHD